MTNSTGTQSPNTGDLTGVITEEATGETLPGVNVRIVGTNFGAATDIDGRFLIKSIRPGEYTLRDHIYWVSGYPINWNCSQGR